MAIADTRIARSAGNVLTEHGPKLLPITVVCRQPGASGFFDKEIHRADIGFAYSGSTLSALAAHALASILCSNLTSNPARRRHLWQKSLSQSPAYQQNIFATWVSSPGKTVSSRQSFSDIARNNRSYGSL
jgi:hypothetical protein